MRLGQLLVWCGFGNINVQPDGGVSYLRFSGMEIRKLWELLQPAHGDALGAIDQSVPATRSDLHHALGEARSSRRAVVAELAGRCFRIEEGHSERLDLLPVINALGIQLLLQVIDNLRVSYVG